MPKVVVIKRKKKECWNMAVVAKPKKKPVAKRAAKKKETLIVYLLDETGSMFVVRSAAISGFNEYVDSMKKQPGPCSMMLVTFNSSLILTRFSKKPIAKVAPLSSATYFPTMNTPLYDAIGQTIKEIDESKETADIVFVIHTDGQENCSRGFSREEIFRLIESKKKEGWVFIFLGADQDAWTAAHRIGIPIGSTISYDNTPVGTRDAYRGAARFTAQTMSLADLDRLNAAVRGLNADPTDLRKKKGAK